MEDESAFTSASPGRPNRSFRDWVVHHITAYVKSAEQMASLAQILRYQETTLRRWVREDVPSFEFPSSTETARGEPIEVVPLYVDDEELADGALGDVQRSVLECQADTLVRSLRKNSDRLSMGDVRILLNSRFGRLIEQVKLGALLDPQTHRTPSTSPERSKLEIGREALAAAETTEHTSTRSKPVGRREAAAEHTTTRNPPQPSAVPPPVFKAETARKILEVLQRQKKPLTSTALAGLVGTTPPKMYTALKMLRDRGEVTMLTSAGTPVYELTGKTQE